MQAKNPISKALTMFQLEVNNQIDFLTKDIPKEAKGSVVKGLRMYGEILAASYFFNDVYEKMTGRRSALDPVGIALDSVADFSGTEVRNSIDIIADLLQGEGLQLTEEKEKKSVSDSFLNLGENIGANVPFIGTRSLMAVVFHSQRIAKPLRSKEIPWQEKEQVMQKLDMLARF